MSSVNPPRLLVVDDEEAQMAALCNTLKDQGYEPLGFTSATAALLALREQPCDLLLTDLTMPEMDGIALLRAAMAIDPQMVGIVMTGDGTIASAVQAMKTGAFDYILKPFRMSAILPVLARAMEVRRLRLENTALAQRVQEYVAQLEERNRALATANEELMAFSSSVSHDLRAPLRIIDSFAQILTSDFEQGLAPEARQMLGTISQNAKRLHQLVADLLQLSKLARQPLTKRPVNLHQLMHAVVAEVRAQFGPGASHDPEVHIGALRDCAADPSLLRQVAVNLLSNAFKFTRHRPGARIEVGCLAHQEGREEAVYFVKDNGAGFDMAYMDKLFGPFQRLHSSEDYEGTGVGLSIAHRIVQRHGGRIWAEAEVDKGATFFFTLG